MKEEMLRYIDERIAWHQGEQARLKAEYRQDEANHMQIAINVYNIFRSTYQAMKFDLDETVRRFSAITAPGTKATSAPASMAMRRSA